MGEKIPQVSSPLVEVKNLSLNIGDTASLKKISFTIGTQEIVSIVGESGSGKSITALTLIGLHPKNALINAQQLKFDGENINGLSSKKWSNIRGKSIGMVFQEPQSSLNPSMKCGKQLQEVLQQHTLLNAIDQKKTIYEVIKEVQLTDTSRILSSYPHQLSGGQKQRICIARALAAKPDFIICDEVTSALDQIVQEGILKLLMNLQEELGLTYLFITHDISTVKAIADQVVVMNEGLVVEQGPKSEVFNPPHPPYTELLLSSVPEMDPNWLDELNRKRKNNPKI